MMSTRSVRAASWTLSVVAHAGAAAALTYFLVTLATMPGDGLTPIPSVSSVAVRRLARHPSFSDSRIPVEYGRFGALEARADDRKYAEERPRAFGAALDYLSDKPFDGRAVYDISAGNGGGGGRFGSRHEIVHRGHAPPSRGAGGDANLKRAIDSALDWLARHQDYDGAWRPRDCCAPFLGSNDHEIGLTALAILAHQRAGVTHHDSWRLRSAWRTLLAKQDADGAFGRAASRGMYNHLFVTLALAEAPPSILLREPLARAVAWLLAAQNPGHGWRYGFQSGDNDSVVTAWAVLALNAARRHGIEIPERAINGARFRFAEADNRPGLIDNTRLALAAGGWGNLDQVRRSMPQWTELHIDFSYWYAGALALRETKSGQAWLAAAARELTAHQERDGCKRGSWEPCDRWSPEGGRIYAAAMNALTLELCNGR